MSEPTEEINLHAALAEQTEQKTPGTSTGPAWNFEQDEQIAAEAEESAATDGGKDDFLRTDNRPAGERINKPRVPDEVKRASAETATAALDSLLSMTCVPLIDRKIRKRLTEEEMDLGFNLEDKKDDELNDEELRIKNKFTRLMKLRQHKIDNVELSTKEIKNVETAFYNYFKIKDIAMPPEWLLYISLGSIVIDRVIEVVTD